MDSGLDGADLAVALALWSYADDAGRCWPAVASLAHRAGCSERTAQRALRSLREAGILASAWIDKATPHYWLRLDALPPDMRGARCSPPVRAPRLLTRGCQPDTPWGDNLTPAENPQGDNLTPPDMPQGVILTGGGVTVSPLGCQSDTRTPQEPPRNPPSSSRVQTSPSHLQGGSVPGANSKPNPVTPPQGDDDLDWLDAIGASLDADREAASLAALEASAADMGARSTQAPRADAPPAPPPAPTAPPALTPTASAAPALTPTASAPPPGPTIAETIARLDAATPQQREQSLGLELMAAVARRSRAEAAGPDWSTLPPLGERRPLPARPRFAAPPLEHDEAAQLWRAAADHRWRWPQASAAVLRLVDRAGLDALRVRLAWVAERHDALGVAPDWSRVMACA